MTLEDDAHNLLASRSIADAAETLSKLFTRERALAREQAALDLDALHKKLLSTQLRGRSVGAIAESARYLRTGHLEWLTRQGQQPRRQPRKEAE